MEMYLKKKKKNLFDAEYIDADNIAEGQRIGTNEESVCSNEVIQLSYFQFYWCFVFFFFWCSTTLISFALFG